MKEGIPSSYRREVERYFRGLDGMRRIEQFHYNIIVIAAPKCLPAILQNVSTSIAIALQSLHLPMAISRYCLAGNYFVVRFVSLATPYLSSLIICLLISRRSSGPHQEAINSLTEKLEAGMSRRPGWR